MTNQEQKQAIVGEAANAFARVETAHDTLKSYYDDLSQAITRAADAGILRHAEGVAMLNDIEDAKGRNASALAKVLKTHAQGTKYAIREKCDVPPTLAFDGGLIRPMSGGR